MTTIGFPTGDFPAPLPFAMELPEGWLGAHVPGTLLAAYRPPADESNQFRPNVVVTWERISTDTPLREVVETAVARVLRESPSMEVVSSEAATVADSYEAVLCRFREPLKDVTLLRATLFVLGPRTGRIRDLYQIVGTYPSGDDPLNSDMRSCLLSFALATPVAAI